MDPSPPLTPRARAIALTTGLGTGVAAGLVGVGGGEFRIPALVAGLRLPIREAASVNLGVGLCTVVVSLARRAGAMTWTTDAIVLGATMIVASVFGAIGGCLWRARVPVRPLKWILTIYLILVGVWMVYESLTRTEHVLFAPTGFVRLAVAGLVAFVIAWTSGVFGVAGGEMRIPALLYLFGLPLKDAGTLSLLVSIATVASGVVTDRQIGRMPNAAVTLALLMGAASVVGVLVGAAWLPHVNAHALKGILGGVLLLATVRLMVPVRSAKS